MISSFGGYGSGVASAALQKLFSRTDTNTDSSLSRDELVDALGKSARTSDSGDAERVADDLVSGLDGDSDGAVNQTEFQSFADQFDYGSSGVLLAAQESSQREARFQSSFSGLDGDGSGGISQDELSSALSSLSSLSSSSTDGGEQASALFEGLDGDDDGSVSQDEVKEALDAAESEGAGPPPGPPPSGPPPSGGGSGGGMASAGGSGGGGSSSEYDPLDTNQDGYVSAEERAAGEGTSGPASADFQSLFAGLDSDSSGLDELSSALSSASGGPWNRDVSSMKRTFSSYQSLAHHPRGGGDPVYSVPEVVEMTGSPPAWG